MATRLQISVYEDDEYIDVFDDDTWSRCDYECLIMTILEADDNYKCLIRNTILEYNIWSDDVDTIYYRSWQED